MQGADQITLTDPARRDGIFSRDFIRSKSSIRVHDAERTYEAFV